MTDDRDPILQTLFAGSRQELDGEAFTARVMARSRFTRARLAVGWICAAAIPAACLVLLVAPLQELAWLLAQGLTRALFDLGDGWLALVISPINSVAGALALGFRAIRTGRKRIRSLSTG